MNRTIIDLSHWRLTQAEYIQESGITTQEIILAFKNIDEDETVEQTYDVKAQSEHFILAGDFAIKRDSWEQSGEGSENYLNIYDILEILEDSVGK